MKFAILFFALFFAACNNIFETPKPQNTETGYFSLALGTTDTARTIMPEEIRDAFAAYTLEFTADGKTSVTADRTDANLSDPVALSAGTWDLTVSAFWNEADTAAAARARSNGRLTIPIMLPQPA